MIDAIQALEDIEYASSAEYRNQLSGLEDSMWLFKHQPDKLRGLQEKYVELVIRYGACTKESRKLYTALVQDAERDIMMLEQSSANLDSDIEQAYIVMPCTGGIIDMARLKQRISILGAQQWVTGNTLADVLEKAIAKATEAANARCEAKPVAPTFGAFFEDYRASFWRGLRPNTLEAYKRSSKNHILPRFGDVPIDEITTTDIQQMYDDIADAGKAQETIKKVRNVMSPVMDYAVEQGIIAKNPLASKRLTIRGKETKPHKALTAEEMRHIRETMPSLPDDQRRLMALMCWSGERIGEILGFRWEDIDMPNGVLHINRGVTHPTRNQATVGEPKTKNSLRTVTLTSAMLEMLKPMQSSGFILGGEKPLSYSMCRALVKKSLAAVDAAGYTSHDFRDTCATEWMEAGVNMKVISQMLGHADINVTARRYTKVRENSLESAAEAINNYQQKLACV